MIKRIIVLFLIVALSVGAIGNTLAAEYYYKLGDVNNDKEINAMDAMLVLQHAVGKIKLTGEAKRCADVSYNYYLENTAPGIDAEDALLILQKSVGKLEHFPCEKTPAI